MRRMETTLEMLLYSPFDKLTQLLAREHFIEYKYSILCLWFRA